MAGFGQRHIPIASGIGFHSIIFPEYDQSAASRWLYLIGGRPVATVLAVPLYGPSACNSFHSGPVAHQQVRFYGFEADLRVKWKVRVKVE
jgi:hypothetical protein